MAEGSYLYKVGGKVVNMGRRPVMPRFAGAETGRMPIDPGALRIFRRELIQHSASLQRDLNLTEREICLASPADKQAVLNLPAAKADKDSAEWIAKCRDVHLKSYNATMLFSLLTFLTYGRALYKGPPGSGKTTTAEGWGNRIYGIPMDWLQAATIYGNDKLTEELVIARFDIGKLTQGYEDVQERLFALLPFRMIDELNRIPSHILSILYQLVDRTLHVYGNDHLVIPPGALFATINERTADVQHSGNFPIPRPFYDRFDVAMIVPGLNPFNFHTLLSKVLLEGAKVKPQGEGLDRTKKKKITRENIDNLVEMWEAKSKMEAAQAEIEKVGFPNFPNGDLVAQVEFFLAQIFYCEQMAKNVDLFWANKAYRQKKSLKDRCENEADCRDIDRICKRTDNYQASVRAQQSIIKYTRAFTWLTAPEDAGAESLEVLEKTVEAFLPFIMSHRIYSEEDDSPESVKHANVKKIWDDSNAQFKKDEIYGLVRDYNLARQEFEAEIGRDHRIDLSSSSRREKLTALMRAIRDMGNVARIPMLINMMELIGEHGRQ